MAYDPLGFLSPSVREYVKARREEEGLGQVSELASQRHWEARNAASGIVPVESVDARDPEEHPDAQVGAMEQARHERLSRNIRFPPGESERRLHRSTQMWTGHRGRRLGMEQLGRSSYARRGFRQNLLATADDVETASEVSWLRHLGAVDTFDDPRRVLWAGGTALAALMPDPTPQERDNISRTLGNMAGDAATWVARGYGVAAGLVGERLGKLFEKTALEKEIEGWGVEFLPQDGLWGFAAKAAKFVPTMAQRTLTNAVGLPVDDVTSLLPWEIGETWDRWTLYGDIGANLYRAGATGELFRAGIGGPSYWVENHNVLLPNPAALLLSPIDGMGLIESGIGAPDIRLLERGSWGVQETDYFAQWLRPGSGLHGRDGMFGRSENPIHHNTQGVDIIDAALPVELAERLAETFEEGSGARDFFEGMSTHTGRHLLGIAMEMTVDPLWLAGPAKGGMLVHKADKAYRVSRSVVESSSFLTSVVAHTSSEVINRSAKEESLLRHGLNIILKESDEEVQVSTKAFQEAIGQAQSRVDDIQERVDEYTRIIENLSNDPDAALTAWRKEQELQKIRLAAAREAGPSNMSRHSKVAKRQKAQWDQDVERHTQRLNEQMAALDKGEMGSDGVVSGLQQSITSYSLRQKNLIQGTERARETLKHMLVSKRSLLTDETGSLVWHIPFTESTLRLFPDGDLVGKVFSPLATAANKGASLIVDPAKALSKIVKEGSERAAAKRRSTATVPSGSNGVSYGEALSAIVHSTLKVGTDVTVKAPLELASWTWDLLASMVGHRGIRPYLTKIRNNAEFAHLASSGMGSSVLHRLGFADVVLGRVSNEIWNAYQSAWSEYARTLSAADSDVQRFQIMAFNEAKRVYEARLAEGTMTEAQSFDDVLVEANHYWEIGSGKMELERQDLIPLREIVEDFIKTLSDRINKPVQEIQQSLVQMVLRGDMKGDAARYREQMRLLQPLKDNATRIQREIDLLESRAWEGFLSPEARELIKAARESKLNDELAGELSRLEAVLKKHQDEFTSQQGKATSKWTDADDKIRRELNILKERLKEAKAQPRDPRLDRDIAAIKSRTQKDLRASHKEHKPKLYRSRKAKDASKKKIDSLKKALDELNKKTPKHKSESTIRAEDARKAALSDLISQETARFDELVEFHKRLIANQEAKQKSIRAAADAKISNLKSNSDRAIKIRVLDEQRIAAESSHRSARLLFDNAMEAAKKNLKLHEDAAKAGKEAARDKFYRSALDDADLVIESAKREYVSAEKLLHDELARAEARLIMDDGVSFEDYVNNLKPRIASSDERIAAAKKNLEELENQGRPHQMAEAKKAVEAAEDNLMKLGTQEAQEALDEARSHYYALYKATGQDKINKARKMVSLSKKDLPLEEWEIELWSWYQQMTQPSKYGYSILTNPGPRQSFTKRSIVDGEIVEELSPVHPAVRDYTEEEWMLAAMSVQRNIEPPEAGYRLGRSIEKDVFKRLTHKWGERSLVGQRLVDRPPDDLLYLVKMFGETWASYSDRLDIRGADFILDPVTRMRSHMVVNYAPHIKNMTQPEDHAEAIKLLKEAKDKAVESGDATAIREATEALNKEIMDRDKAAIASANGFASWRQKRANLSEDIRRGTSKIEDLLGAQIDSQRSRFYAGTAAEVNASTVIDATFTFDPMLTSARMMQFNRSIGADDFLAAMFEGGVVRTFVSTPEATAATQAFKAGYIPLYRSSKARVEGLTTEMAEIIFNGSREDWKREGVTAEMITGLIEANKKPERWQAWLRSVPRIRQASRIEHARLLLRNQQFIDDLDVPLEDLQKAFDARMMDGKIGKKEAWEEIANKLNEVLNTAGETGPTIRGSDLSNYYEKSAWRLYVPRQVAESMAQLHPKTLMTIAQEADADRTTHVLRFAGRLGRQFNEFWKARVTILSLGFIGRNHVTNTISNLIDLGPGAAFDPKTQLQAALISHFAPLAEVHGSVARAMEVMAHKDYASSLPAIWKKQPYVLANPLSWAKGMKEGAAKGWAHLDMPHKIMGSRLWFANKVLGTDVLKGGMDLGDGILRSLDECIVELRNSGIIAPNYHQYVDLDRVAQQAGIIAAMKKDPAGAAGVLKSVKDGVRESASTAEDIFFMTAPAMVSGGLWVPLSLGKHYNAGLSRFIENQARMINFQGNLRRGGSWDSARAHVEKYLFNYDDLTGVQKHYLRPLIPFFVWRHRNLMLQGTLAKEKPIVFAAYQRLLLEGAPKMVAAMNRDEAGLPYAEPRPYSPGSLKSRRPYQLSRIRVPIPGLRNVAIEGLQTPIEAAMEEVGLLEDFIEGFVKARVLTPTATMLGINTEEARRINELRRAESEIFGLRWASRANFLTKLAVERITGHHFFYDMSIEDMNNARQIGAAIKTLEAYPLGIGPALSQGMRHLTGYYEMYSPKRNAARALATRIYQLGNQPYSRLLSDQAAALDVFNSSLASDPDRMREAGLDVGEWSEIGVTLRYLRVLTGVKVISESPWDNRHFYEQGWTDAYEKWMVDHDILEELPRTVLHR